MLDFFLAEAECAVFGLPRSWAPLVIFSQKEICWFLMRQRRSVCEKLVETCRILPSCSTW